MESKNTSKHLPWCIHTKISNIGPSWLCKNSAEVNKQDKVENLTVCKPIANFSVEGKIDPTTANHLFIIEDQKTCSGYFSK